MLGFWTFMLVGFLAFAPLSHLRTILIKAPQLALASALPAAVIVSSLSQSHSFIRPWLTITQDMKEVIVCTLTTTRTGYYYYCVLLRAEPSTQTEQMDLCFDFRPIVFKVAYFLADIFTLIL